MFSRHLKEAAVVIPIYNTMLRPFELIGLQRCFNVLSGHSIFFVAPEGLSLDELSLPPESFRVVTFSKDYFGSIAGYNKLMLSTEFYERFLDYRYILIHQLDAFVFSDQLSYWCSLNYDYIGAPWIEGNWKDEFSHSSLGVLRKLRGKGHEYVGNGGFSLRKVKKALLVLKVFHSMAKSWKNYEDIFWGLAVPAFFPFFKVPHMDIALRFSFETNPRQCFMKNNFQLPFGCHAWEKYDIDFWRPYFAKSNYTI